MKQFQKLFVMILVASLALSACNMPTSTQNSPDAAFTAAAQTVEAQLTQNALLNPPSKTPELIFPSETAQPTLAITNTPVPPSPTATAVCDLGVFVNDVTVPDGTEFKPGETFTKTWRIKNIGTCTWTSGYQVIFDSGDVMGGSSPQALAGTVAPGQTVDVSVNLTAPGTPGAYRGYWRLRNQAGVLVPIASGYQGQSFFVDIKVPQPTATPTATLTATPTLIQLTIIPLTLVILPSATPTP